MVNNARTMQSKVQHIAQFQSHDLSIVLTSFQSPVSDRPAESTKFKITVVVFPGIFQDGSAWLYASYGHAPSRP